MRLGLSLDGVLRIDLALIPDLGVGGWGFKLKMTLLLGEKNSSSWDMNLLLGVLLTFLTGVLLRAGMLEMLGSR